VKSITVRESRSNDMGEICVNDINTGSIKFRVEPTKIAPKGFIALNASAGHGEFQKKSLHKSDPGKGG